MGNLNVGPESWTFIWPILWPASTASSTLLPSARAPRNPPANASPAPFVSTILSAASAETGYVWRPEGTSDDEVDAATVDEAPCVMTTMRAVDSFFLGRAASFWAMVGMSLVCEASEGPSGLGVRAA